MTNTKTNVIKAVIFDFDGVLANTDLYHFIAWKKAVRLIDINMDQSIQHKLRGLTREATLSKILEIFNKEISENKFQEVMKEKNKLYKTFLKEVTIDDVLPGIIDFLSWLKENNYKTGVASISKNSGAIIKNIGLDKYIDIIVDPETIQHIKPEPDIFIMASKLLNIRPWECIGIEDSQVGIDAINSSLMLSIGIDFHNDLERCSLKLKSTAELTPDRFLNFIKELK